MSDFLSVIKQRRSVRKYKKEPVPIQIIDRILKTAVYAPSAHNAQPWRFIVLTDKNQKEALANAMAQVWITEMKQDHTPKSVARKTAGASVKRFTSAPILVICCITLEDMDSYPDEERQRNERDLAVQSLAAAVQNLLLSAHSEGLGTCWFCAPIFCKAAVRRVLKIPDGIEPQALITVGYPVENPSPPPRHESYKIAFLNWYGNPIN